MNINIVSFSLLEKYGWNPTTSSTKSNFINPASVGDRNESSTSSDTSETRSRRGLKALFYFSVSISSENGSSEVPHKPHCISRLVREFCKRSTGESSTPSECRDETCPTGNVGGTWETSGD